MATHQIGKFKFRFSKEGFQYKWGDGEVRSIGFGGSKKDPEDEYRYQGDDSDYAYGENDGYYQDGGEGYDDGYYYEDDRQDEGEFYYDEENADEIPGGQIMEYIENNLWVLIALLVVLPPVGIYLLWRLNRFEYMTRIISSAASAIWFIIILILIFSGIFGGGNDIPTAPEMTLTSMRPTVTPTVAPIATPVATSEPDDILGGLDQPTATPLASGNTGSSGSEAASGNNVYSPQTGLYYHKVDNCSRIDSNVSLTLVTADAAKNRNQSPCPLCFGGTVYYATTGGSRYHTDRTCDGMQNAVEYSKEAAEREGKVACHICAGGKDPSSSDDGKSNAQKYAATITNDKSGIKVWMTSGGSAYHATENCRGMSGASQVSLLKALQAGKPACSECLSYMNYYVYATSSGKYYHSAATTCGMKNGTRVTLSAALVLGKKKCPDCIDTSLYTNKEEESTNNTTSGDISVYLTETGSYYHTDAACGGMKNASKVALKEAIKIGRPACPVCCPSANKTVYAVENGDYYHSYAGCSSMKNPIAGSLAKALAYGYTACPKCWTSNGEASENTENGNEGYSGIYVYATETSTHYHASKSCSELPEGATRVLLEQAIDDGKKNCSKCADYADDKVYGATGNKYFHKNSSCSGIVGAKSGTVADALLLGLEVCPICFDEDDFPTEAVTENKYVNGKSGIKVYASTDSRYYHINMLCSRISGVPAEVSLETALNYDKSACPVCSRSADRTVYGNKDGKYYHYSSSCAGESSTSGHLDTALALGLKACPNCVTNSEANEEEKPGFDEFVSGTSGFKVFAKASEKYYHTDSDCGGMTGASEVTLEKALNYGFTACPDCAALGSRKVYAQEGSNIYHADSDCAGSGYISGTLDKALGYGMKACPVCITSKLEGEEEGSLSGELGNASGEEFEGGSTSSGNGGSAAANTRVYVDLSGDSSAFLYHTDKKCSESGMTGGTAVTLEYALDSGFSDCGYCNPPTSIEEVE